MSKYTDAIRKLAKMKALDAENAEKLLNAHVEEQDGGPGSGNFGHAGRPGKIGGSAKGEGGASATTASTGNKTVEVNGKQYSYDPKKFSSRPKDGRGNWGHGGRSGGGSTKTGTGGRATGNAGRAPDGTVYSGKDYTLRARGLRTLKRTKNKQNGKWEWTGPGKTWEAKGKKSEVLPNGSGTTRISEKDVVTGLHTVNKHLNPDGTFTPERQALHEQIIQDMFKGKKPKGPGEPKTLYFLGGGSASGKGSFTKPEKAAGYGMPDKNAVTVVDADALKKKLPEYDPDSPTGTTDRNKAANFAHEESSALAKRAIEAAYANGYDVTLDGTGDSGADKVKKKIAEARKNGYRVEGRYCTASIENALVRNVQRAKKEGRLVDNDSVIGIHKDVSRIFREVAPEFDHVELWDHDGPKPVLVASCERGKQLQIHDPKLFKKFEDKAHWGEG